MEKAKHKNYVVSHATYEGRNRSLWIDNEYGKEICRILPDADGRFVNPYNKDTKFGEIVEELIKIGVCLPIGNYVFSYF